MNSSTVLKRTLPLLIVILIIIGISVSCSVLNREKPVPAIGDAEDLYFSINEGDRTYSITNGKMYNKLKSSVGLSLLLEKIDTDLLKATKVAETNTSYWDLVTDEDINESLEKDIFPESDYPDGTDDLTEDEKAEKRQEYFDTMFSSYGLKTEAEVKDYHHLKLAKKEYAKDQLEIAINEANQKAETDTNAKPYFDEDKYKTYYEANYKNGYWAIIVPFANADEGEAILEQLGIEIDANNKNNWIHSSDKQPLTPAEVAQAFIDMYNTVHAKDVEGYPTDRITVTEGMQYTINDGKVEFPHVVSSNDALNEFYFTYQDLVDYQAEIQTFLNVSMNSYDPNATTLPTTRSWYTPKLKSYNAGKLQVYILKIAEESAPSLESVRGEITLKLKEAELTDQFIGKEIVQLRALNGLTIYDQELESSYITNVESYDEKFAKSNASDEKLVATVGNKNYSADELFDFMDKRFGYILSADEINYQRLLNNKEFNKIYDYYLKDADQKIKILDEEKWNDVRERTIREKQNFVSGAYSNYGYQPSYGWKNFIRDYYNVENESELIYYFLYSEVLTEYSKSLADVSEAGEDSELWKTYEKEMQEIVDDYFNVTGVHLLISVNDKSGNPIDPKDWTETQKNYAEELYRKVWNYYDAETASASQKLQDIQNYFNKAPLYLAKYQPNPSDQPVLANRKYVLTTAEYIIELSKYKSAGLSVKFEDLGSFTNGKMVKEFDEAVRSIWKQDPDSKVATPYGHIPGSSDYQYLVTEFGYHVYVNLSSTDISKWDDTHVLPTLQMVKTYLKDSASKYLLDDEGNQTTTEFTDAMKTAVTTYFEPIKNEISGSYNTTITLYNQIKGLNIQFNSGNYSRDDFNRFLELRIKSYQENLTYLTTEQE